MNPVSGAGGIVLNPDDKVLIVQYKDGSWTYPKGHIEEHEDDGTISKAMHLLDMTMATHMDVLEICYGLHHLGGPVGFQGYINFFAEKNQFMVMQLLLGFQLRDMDYFEDTNRFVDLLCHNSLFVKMEMPLGELKMIILSWMWSGITLMKPLMKTSF